jgi:hypothetical protein
MIALLKRAWCRVFGHRTKPPYVAPHYFKGYGFKYVPTCYRCRAQLRNL